uniref:Uncharacterized protein n=1 Tax=Opuntia streptacantha TaxID=393608 RepID=A0A7C8ZC75_OPUST
MDGNLSDNLAVYLSASPTVSTYTSVRSTPLLSTLVTRPIAESCDISLRFILLFFSILAESSRGSITSTAHPMDSLAFNNSNNSSLFSSLRVFESAKFKVERVSRKERAQYKHP